MSDENFTAIKPLRSRVLFQFIEDLDNTAFNQRTESGIVLVENKENQVDDSRWGKVLAVGPDARNTISVNDYILVEPLGWTNGMTVEGVDGLSSSTRFWFTDLEKIMCVSEDMPEI